MAFTGIGQNDYGGQANPGVQLATLVWATTTVPTAVPTALRGPIMSGVIYQTGGGGATSGYGQIFPTGRS